MTPFDCPNYTQVPNDLLGDAKEPGMMADMTMAELKFVLALSRLTFGYHRENVRASLTTIQRMTGMSRQSVIDGAARAEKRGLVEKHNDGGVTEWSIIITSPETRLVYSLDQTSLENRPSESETSLNSRPPSIKEKNLNKEEKNIPADAGKDEADCTKKSMPAREMFSALSDVCRFETKLITQAQRGQLNQTGKKLREQGIGPPDVQAFGEWWFMHDWRGIKNQPPKPHQVREEWGQFTAWRNGTNGANTNGNNTYGAGHFATGIGKPITAADFADE